MGIDAYTNKVRVGVASSADSIATIQLLGSWRAPSNLFIVNVSNFTEAGKQVRGAASY